MTARNRLQIVIPVLLLIAAAVLVTNVFPFRQILATERSIDLAGERLDTLRTENRRLEAEVAALSTDAELERLARSEFGYVAPGEIAYVITDPNEPARSAEDPVVLEPSRMWYEAIWAFLTGEDYVTTYDEG